MRQRMMGAALLALLVMANVAMSAQGDKRVAGQWRMTIDFPSGARTATLDLTVDGPTLTGKFSSSFSGEVPLEGEVEGVDLRFSGTTTSGPHPGVQIDFTGRLTDDNALGGSMSAHFGDFKWTASRVGKSGQPDTR